MDFVYADFDNYGKLDYVASWYKKAAEMMSETNIKAAFVSTNSLCQGESVAIMWKPLVEKYDIHIDFAYRTFVWDNRAQGSEGKKVKTDRKMAAVHCVIIGFSSNQTNNSKRKFIVDEAGVFHQASTINGYLMDAPTIFIQNRGNSLSGMPRMTKGSQPTDGGNLLLSPIERAELINKEPNLEKWIYRFMQGEDFINDITRYCLWMVGASPSEIKKSPSIMDRANKVRTMRLSSPTRSVQRDAEKPTLFTQIRQPNCAYLAIPRVSSEKRKYIPMAILPHDVIAGDMLQFIEEASLYLFGILESCIHMDWMRIVAGRLKSDYRYSPAVYNNFPWPTPSEEQKAKIEQSAQAILDARAIYPDSSLADLYDELTMPIELRKAHQANDAAVMAAYGFPKTYTESDIVAALMKMYKDLTDK